MPRARPGSATLELRLAGGLTRRLPTTSASRRERYAQLRPTSPTLRIKLRRCAPSPRSNHHRPHSGRRTGPRPSRLIGIPSRRPGATGTIAFGCGAAREPASASATRGSHASALPNECYASTKPLAITDRAQTTSWRDDAPAGDCVSRAGGGRPAFGDRPERGSCFHVGAVLSPDADDTLAFVPMQARVECPADAATPRLRCGATAV
jgi:hypothetical protein